MEFIIQPDIGRKAVHERFLDSVVIRIRRDKPVPAENALRVGIDDKRGHVRSVQENGVGRLGPIPFT